MKIVLFALTGYGNEALKTLVKQKQQVALLVTRKEKGSFPYYREENIINLAKKLKIPFTYQFPEELSERIKRIKPDLILVSSYHRLIPKEIYNLAKSAVNIHPSLLPKYKGSKPTLSAIINGEKTTGLSAHFLTEQFDSGPVIFRQKVKISRDESDCSLRKKLTLELRTFIPKLLKQINR